MTNKLGKILLLAILAFTGIIALGIQLEFAIEKTSASTAENIARYFSYFTIQANMMVTVTAVTSLIWTRSKWVIFFSSGKVASAIAVYIIIVGLVYNLVLRKLYHIYGLERFANELLHVYIPVLFVIYWVIYIPKKELTWNVFPWLLYPLSFGAYTLIRGAFVNYYPYPFLDVLKLGYPKVFLSFFVLLILFLLVSVILVSIGKVLTRRANH